MLEFSIKPRLCVLSAGEEVCRDTLEVRWSADRARSLCLYRADDDQPLRCWEQATKGSFNFELSARTTTRFQLREQGAGEPLGQQDFRVVHEERKYRHPRRNPWSFF